MAFNLLEALSNTIGPQLSNQGARMFEESPVNTQSAVGAILPALLGGVMKQGSTSEGASGLLQLLNGPSVDEGLAANPAAALGGGAGTNALMNSGSNLLKTFLGDKTNAVGNAVSSISGVKSSSAIGLLSLAAPMVLGFLKKYVMQNRLNAGGLMSLLSSQSGFLQGKLDSRITQAMGLGDAPGFLSNISGMASRTAGAGAAKAEDLAGRAADAATGAAQAAGSAGRSAGRAAMGFATQTADRAHHMGGPRFGRLLQWVLALIVLALLFAMFRSCAMHRNQEAALPQRSEQTMQPSGQTMQGGQAGAAMTTITLPGGATLSAPSGGFIERITTSLNNPGSAAGKGYALDAVAFETGSANLMDSSNQQLNDLATVLQAYPTAVVAVNGYTDNTGDMEANRTLSQQRADAVREMLIGRGIAAERITATGHGAEQPVADNDSEAGRSKNRRVEVVITRQ